MCVRVDNQKLQTCRTRYTLPQNCAWQMRWWCWIEGTAFKNLHTYKLRLASGKQHSVQLICECDCVDSIQLEYEFDDFVSFSCCCCCCFQVKRGKKRYNDLFIDESRNHTHNHKFNIEIHPKHLAFLNALLL